MKKKKAIITSIILISMLIIPLIVGEVTCNWNYYTNKATSGSSTITGLTISGFKYNELVFPSAPEGDSNKGGQDIVIGTPDSPVDKNQSLSNPNSLLNMQGLNSTVLAARGNRDFITGEDYNLVNLVPTKFKDILQTPKGFHFLIHRITMEDVSVQEYALYSTEVDINKINSNNKDDNIIYPVFKTNMIWESIDGSNGKWTTLGVTMGYAPLVMLKETGIFKPNSYPFFDHTQFKEGYKGTTFTDANYIYLNEDTTAFNNGEDIYFKSVLETKGNYELSIVKGDANASITLLDANGNPNGKSDTNLTLNASKANKEIYFKVSGVNTQIKLIKKGKGKKK